MIKRYVVGVSLVLMASTVSYGANFHVAADGIDSNPGSSRKLFATITRALAATRSAAGPNTILLAPGRYFNEASIVLDERDSGLTIRGKKSGAGSEVASDAWFGALLSSVSF